MLGPYAAGACLLFAVPALMTFVLAFTEYDALSSPRWIGFENFAEIVADPMFWIATRNSLFLILLSIPLRVAGALALALLLHRRFAGANFFRAAVYLPTVIPDAAYALIGLWVFNPIFGPANLLLGGLGLPTPGWLADARTAKLVFVALALFQIGEGFVMMLVGRRSIPDSYYEAATLEGAGAWHSFRFITLPLLAPWLLLLTVRDLVMSMHTSFTHSYMMTGGDPYYSTLFLSYLAYEEAFDRFRFGPGSAIMLVMFLAGLGLIAGIYALFRKRGHFGGE